MIKLIRDFAPDDLKFKSTRRTQTGARIIDTHEDVPLYQTPWTNVAYDVEDKICVECDSFKNILQEIDDLVSKHASKELDFNEEEVKNMYRPLNRGNLFYVPLSTNLILFDEERRHYGRSKVAEIVKRGHKVRFVIDFKKIYFRNHEITFPFEIIQIEKRG